MTRHGRHAAAGALVTGLAAANAARAPAGVAVAVLAVACLAAAAVLDERRALAAVAPALLLAGWWWGSVRVEQLEQSVLERHVGESAPAEVVVTGPVRRGAFALRVPADVRRFGSLPIREPALLQLPHGRSPPRGAILRLVVRVERPRGPETGWDERGWLARRGAHVVLSGSRWHVVGARGGVHGLGDRLRRTLAAGLGRGLPAERRGVIAGIVLGEDEALSDELRESFRAAGLYHLLAVSGTNVALIAASVLIVARAVGAPLALGQLGVLAAIALYVLAVGWEPSVVRAGVAGGLVALAWLAARPADRWWFLLVGAVVLLAWNPRSLLEPGFQLSFAAVAGIFLVVPRLQARLEGFAGGRLVAELALVSAVCGAVTAPIVWLHFGAVPLYTVPANALAYPVAGPLLGLGLAAGLASPVAPAVAENVAWLNGFLAAYLAGAARLISGLPLAEVESGPALLVAAAFGALGVASVRTRGGGRLALLAGAAALAVALAAWRLLPVDARPPPEGFRLTALDVGQGDAILLEVPEGAVLVDQGPPEGEVASQLRRLGVRRLALLVLTHPQRDHVGGAEDVLRRLEVGVVLDPGLLVDSPYRRGALAVARERGVRVAVARAGASYGLGALRLRVLWPDGPGGPAEDPNRRAIVLLASYGEVDALLTADAESDVTGRLAAPAEILKVAHHGSADPALPRLLDRVRPRIAVVSVGAANDYGHPAPSTLAALAAVPGLRTYRTDVDGRVTVESDGRRMVVREER